MAKNTSDSDSNVIRQGASYERWRLPDVTNPNATHPSARREAENAAIKPPTAQEIEEIRNAAYKDGFEQGRNEGLQQGQELIRNQLHEFDVLMQGLVQPYSNMDESLLDEVSKLALLLAQQVIRRELQTQPGEIVPLVRESVAMLPSSDRDIRIVLHPEDAELIQNAGLAEDEARRWKIIPDPTVSRGGCRVQTDISMIDATLEKRLNALAFEFLGGGREGDE